MQERYITEEERTKCKKVADAFREVYELMDVVVADAGRFGFIRVKWFKEGSGFDEVRTYWDSETLFAQLWQDWYEYQVLSPVLRTPVAELDYDEILKTFPKNKQEEILNKKTYFRSLCQ